jgi:hypothetical protein
VVATGWQGYLGIAVAIAGFLITYFGFIRSQQDRAVSHENRMTLLEGKVTDLAKREDACPISDLEKEVERLKLQSELFWTVLQPHLANIIHSPIHVRRDELVDKFVKGTATHDEMVELDPMLCDEIKEHASVEAALLLAQVRMCIEQKKTDGQNTTNR